VIGLGLAASLFITNAEVWRAKRLVQREATHAAEEVLRVVGTVQAELLSLRG
jgi:hypothetical protein